MTDTADLLLPDESPAKEGMACDLPPGGLLLHIALPRGRTLAEATLRLAAPPLPAEPRAFTDAALVSNLDGFPAGGADVTWLRATLPQERAVTGIRLLGNAGDAARLRLFSRGAWRAVTPPDMIATGTDPKARPLPLTPVAASAIMVEMLGPFVPAPGAPPIFLPATRRVTGLSLFGTDQPCHVAVSIGAEAPFFLREGPLPAEPVEVDGLLRAAGRFLAERPEATSVPLRIAAAGPARLILSGIQFSLAPPPAAGTGSGQGTGARETRGIGTGGGSAGAAPPDDAAPALSLFPAVPEPAAAAAQLCDGAHWIAQRLDPPDVGKAVVRLDLFLRAGAILPKGSITFHGDEKGKPAPEPLPGHSPVPLGAVPDDTPGWVACTLPTPRQLQSPIWVVCRLTEGEAHWFTAPMPTPPAGVGAALASTGRADWTPAPAAGGKKVWAQLRLGLLPAGAG